MGGASTGGPPSIDRSRFFGSLCLNNYSKIFQKRRIFKLLLEGTQVGNPLGGAPPRPLGPPQGPPGVLEIWKKLQIFPKIMYKNYMHQNTPDFNSHTHFGQLRLLGGPLGGQNGFLASSGGFSDAIALVFFLNVLYRPTTKFWGGFIVKF